MGLIGVPGTMSILAFQPDAKSYYAKGYWRPGDLWSEFAASASLAPAKNALIAGDRYISYAGLERAAVALSGGSLRIPSAPETSSSSSAVTASRRRWHCSRAGTGVRSRRRCLRCSGPSSWRRWPVRRTPRLSFRSAPRPSMPNAGS